MSAAMKPPRRVPRVKVKKPPKIKKIKGGATATKTTARTTKATKKANRNLGDTIAKAQEQIGRAQEIAGQVQQAADTASAAKQTIQDILGSRQQAATQEPGSIGVYSAPTGQVSNMYPSGLATPGAPQKPPIGGYYSGKFPWKKFFISLLVTFAILIVGIGASMIPFISDFSIIFIFIGLLAIIGVLLFFIITKTNILQRIWSVPQKIFNSIKQKISAALEKSRRKKALKKKSWDDIAARAEQIYPLLTDNETNAFHQQMRTVRIFAWWFIITILTSGLAIIFLQMFYLWVFFIKGRKIKKMIKKDKKLRKKEDHKKGDSFYKGGFSSGSGIGKAVSAVLIIIILLIGGASAFWFGYYKDTERGQQLSQQFIQLSSPAYGAERQSRGLFSVAWSTIKSVFTGEYQEMMTSTEADSEYGQYEKLITNIENLAPVRETVYETNPIAIQAYISAEGGLDEGTVFEFDVYQMLNVITRSKRSQQVCDSTALTTAVSKVEDIFDNSTNLCNDEICKNYCTDNSDWVCTLGNNQQNALNSTNDSIPNAFVFKNQYNQRLVCTHSGIQNPTRNLALGNILLVWRYDSTATLQKNIYVFNPDYAALYSNPLTEAEISSSEYQSYSVSEKNIGFGAGISKQRDYIIAPYQNIDDKFIAVYDLIFTIKNTGIGDISQIQDIEVELPAKVKIETKSSDFILSETIERAGETFNIYNLKPNVANTFKNLAPADYENAYLPVYVDADFVSGNSNYEAFTVYASVYYKYRDEDLVRESITVRSSDSTNTSTPENECENTTLLKNETFEFSGKTLSYMGMGNLPNSIFISFPTNHQVYELIVGEEQEVEGISVLPISLNSSTGEAEIKLCIA